MTSRFIERALAELGEGALSSQLQTINLALLYATEELIEAHGRTQSEPESQSRDLVAIIRSVVRDEIIREKRPGGLIREG